MLHDGTRRIGGTMPAKLQDKVDRLLDEFLALVDAISQDRHLQKGVARSLLPCDMLAALDKENLFVVGEFHPEIRFSAYIYDPQACWTPQKVNNSAHWEFGFTDSFMIKFPAGLIEEEPAKRQKNLEMIASEHVDSEFMRFMGLLSLLRTKPIFGSVPAAGIDKSAYLLLPSDEPLQKNFAAITDALESFGIPIILGEDIRIGKSAVWRMWLNINEARVVIADLIGPDPGVMYGLGMAHTLGKDTILIYPKCSNYLADIPKTQRIEYEESDSGRIKLKQELLAILRSLLETMDT